MNILDIGQVNKTNFGIVSSTNYNYCLVSVDAPSVISSVIKEITDNSWLSSLNPIDRVSFEACMKKTVNSIIEECQKYQKQTSGGLYDYKQVGEYIVSKAGRDSLTDGFSHGFIPLAELWKEKEKGNPGFDFHSLSPSEIFIFGEAKYRSEANPYSIAIEQVESFIDDEKDKMEASNLNKITMNSTATTNFLNNKKGFAISFSIKAQNPKDIIENAIKCPEIKNINQYDEFYIIGVIINDK